MFNAERPREIAGRLDKDTRGGGIGGSRAAGDAERQRDKRVTKKPALYFRKGKDSDNPSASFGDPVVGPVAKHVLDDLAPPDAVKEARLSARLDVRLPRLGIQGCERANDDTFHHGPMGGRLP